MKELITEEIKARAVELRKEEAYRLGKMEGYEAGVRDAMELVNKHDPMANKKSNPNYWGNTLRKALSTLTTK